MKIETKSQVPTSVRIPKELDDGLEKIMEREHLPKTAVIVKAIDYYVKADGKVTSDGEYIKNLDTLQENYNKLQASVDAQSSMISDFKTEMAELRKVISQQNIIIENLLNRIPRGV